MDKKLAETVITRANGLCENCGSVGHQIHHIFMGSGKRKQTEREECLILLCVECHQKVHAEKKLNYSLKQKAQKELLKAYDLCEVRKITGGKIYI